MKAMIGNLDRMALVTTRLTGAECWMDSSKLGNILGSSEEIVGGFGFGQLAK